MQPKFSIISPSFNSEKYLDECFKSLHNQSFQDFEHIVVDGGSTDHTHQIIQTFPKAQLIIEPDRGLYDALNKGLHNASGEWVGFLNSDDFYLPGALERAAEVIEKHPEADALAGATDIITGDSSRHLRTIPALNRDTFLHEATAGFPMFNAWFFKRELLEDVGPFNIKYSLGADKDLLLRMYARDFTFLTLDFPTYCYRHHPGSLTGKSGWNQRLVEADFAQIEDYQKTNPFPEHISEAIQKWYRIHLFRMTYWSLFYFRPDYCLKLIRRGKATIPNYGKELARYTIDKFHRVARKIIK